MILKGMTWSHDRGLKPLLAAAQKFKIVRPEVTIQWDARSLSDFEIYPLDQLASKYDFIMIDHPHIGTAYAQNLLTPLDEWIPKPFIEELSKNSVGFSHESYFWEGHQWALAADAAAQFSAYREDVLTELGIKAPKTWTEVFKLSEALKDKYAIAIPFVPIHAYSSFFSMCSQLSERKFWSNGEYLDKEPGIKALKHLERVLDLSHIDSFNMDPINLLDKMSSENEIVYCPLVYGYSTYSQAGYSENIIKFNEMPSDTGKPEGSMIGGVGLSISSKCEHKDVAAEFLMMTMSEEFQKGTFADNCGQPGHRMAWLNEKVNEKSNNFYKDTLQTMDFGSMRPRFNGYIDFQEKAGRMIRNFIKHKRKDYEVFIDELNMLFLWSITRRRGE